MVRLSADYWFDALNTPNRGKTARSTKKAVAFAICNARGRYLQRYTLKMTSKFTLKTLTLTVGFGVLALSAMTVSAQWQWVEKDGRKIFSDRPPPAEIAEKDILKRPPGAARPAAAPVLITPGTETVAGAKPAGAPAAPASKASAPKLSGKDAELEAKKKKAEQEEAAKKKVEEEKVAKAKAENCERAKTGLATLQSGVRMSAVNAKGEREVFDDAKRASETKRAQEVIDASCK